MFEMTEMYRELGISEKVYQFGKMSDYRYFCDEKYKNKSSFS